MMGSSTIRPMAPNRAIHQAETKPLSSGRGDGGAVADFNGGDFRFRHGTSWDRLALKKSRGKARQSVAVVSRLLADPFLLQLLVNALGLDGGDALADQGQGLGVALVQGHAVILGLAGVDDGGDLEGFSLYLTSA